MKNKKAVIIVIIALIMSSCAAIYLYRITDCSNVPIAKLSDLPDDHDIRLPFSLAYRRRSQFTDFFSQSQKKTSHEKELLAITQTTAGHQLEDYVYVDMNHDGSKELIGIYSDDMGFYQTWYCSSDGQTCLLVHQNDEWMDACKINLLDLNDQTHVVMDAYRMMGTRKNYSILSLKGSDISCLASNKYGYVCMTENGDITLDIEAYDGMYDPDWGMSTHTWKDTYLYFDGETYREYGATEITEAEFLKYKNSQEIKDTISNKLKQSDTTKLEYTYFKRKNNILHIQCNVYHSSGAIQYGYYTVRFSGDVLDAQLGEYIFGQMSSSFSDWDVTY